MLGIIDYEAAIHLWNIDKFDFVVCIGVVFFSVEVGLVVAVSGLGTSSKKIIINNNMG